MTSGLGRHACMVCSCMRIEHCQESVLCPMSHKIQSHTHPRSHTSHRRSASVLSVRNRLLCVAKRGLQHSRARQRPDVKHLFWPNHRLRPRDGTNATDVFFKLSQVKSSRFENQRLDSSVILQSDLFSSYKNDLIHESSWATCIVEVQYTISSTRSCTIKINIFASEHNFV